MPDVITPEILVERVCRTLDLPTRDNAESLTEILRVALTETRDQAIGAAKAVCLEIAEDEAERCRGVGATVAQQTALKIAARIRKRHVGHRRPRLEMVRSLPSHMGLSRLSLRVVTPPRSHLATRELGFL
jgi:hypothetical protein